MEEKRIQKTVRRLASDQQGFTLLELIIVLAIIGMLCAIAIPVYSKVVSDAAEKTDQSNISTVETAVETYRATNNALPALTEKTKSKAAFDELITKLHSEGYIKNDAINAQEKGKHFAYDPASGTVTLEADES